MPNTVSFRYQVMAAQTNVDQDTVDSLRQMCLKDVKRAQGTIRLEDAYRFQKPPVKWYGKSHFEMPLSENR